MAKASPCSPTGAYGPFEFGDEHEVDPAHFGRQTDIAVRKFQSQSPFELAIDGKAGISTLGVLEELLVTLSDVQ